MNKFPLLLFQIKSLNIDNRNFVRNFVNIENVFKKLNANDNCPSSNKNKIQKID